MYVGLVHYGFVILRRNYSYLILEHIVYIFRIPGASSHATISDPHSLFISGVLDTRMDGGVGPTISFGVCRVLFLRVDLKFSSSV